MNIESLLERIDLFDELVVESGLLRDLEAYVTAISQPDTQSNLLALKDIARNALESLSRAQEGGVGGALETVLPNHTNFLEDEPEEKLAQLLDDPEVDTPTFFSRLQTILTELNTALKSDKNLLEKRRAVFAPYIEDVTSPSDSSESAVLALVLKDLETVRSLKKFTRALHQWNVTLSIYHQLLSSTSPEDIGLLGVQSGSIDIVFNVDVNVGINLVEVMKLGLEVFGAYLLYKSRVHEIVLSYHGNRKLVAAEKQREEDMLDNVRQAIHNRISEQHKAQKKKDSHISNESVPKKIDEVAETLTQHIIRGNEIRLLSAPVDTAQHEDEASNDNEPKTARELREKTREVEFLRKQLPEKERKQLLAKFENTSDNESGGPHPPIMKASKKSAKPGNVTK
jgi:hypothetical protein